MFLSRIPLDVKRRDTMRALASPQVLHGALESAFPRKQETNGNRILWRVDYLGNACHLLVLSPERPDFLHVAHQLGYDGPEKRWETKDYAPLLARLLPGQAWRFRLRANPVRSSLREKDKPSGRGRIFAHVTQHQQRQWLTDRMAACGFSLADNSFDVVYSEWKKFRKAREGGRDIALRIADFEGVLTISDVESFRNTLLSGIGRAKAYGCGLLTIMRYGAGGGG